MVGGGGEGTNKHPMSYFFFFYKETKLNEILHLCLELLLSLIELKLEMLDI